MKSAGPPFLAVFLLALPVQAAEETPWQQAEYVSTRLVASHKAVPSSLDEPLYLGWHVRLKESWKTYWRSPGDAGQPPRFTWEGSVNVGTVEVLYPLPERFEIFDLYTYGYHDEVLYPLKITPLVEGAPVTARVTAHFLVCDVLCVPQKASYELTIPAASGEAPYSLNAGMIESYLKRVPKKISGNGNIELTAFEVAGEGTAKTVRIRISSDKLLTGADVILENQDGVTFGKPRKRLLRDSTAAEFVVPAYFDSAGREAPKAVTVIVSDGWGYAEEREIPLETANQEGAGA